MSAVGNTLACRGSHGISVDQQHDAQPCQRFPALTLFRLAPAYFFLSVICVCIASALAGPWIGGAALALDVVTWRAFARSAVGRACLSRLSAARARQELVDRLDADYRRELAQLENAALDVRSLATLPSTAPSLDMLLTAYLQLAAACSRQRKLLALSLQTPRLADGSTPQSTCLQAWQSKRNELEKLHHELASRARDGVAEIEGQLAVVADSIRLIHQHAITAGCGLDAAPSTQDVEQLTAMVRLAAESRESATAEIEALIQPGSAWLADR